MVVDEVENNLPLMQKLWKAGLLSHKIFFYRNLYQDYQANIHMNMTEMDAKHSTAVKFDVCLMTVYRAIKIMSMNLDSD